MVSDVERRLLEAIDRVTRTAFPAICSFRELSCVLVRVAVGATIAFDWRAEVRRLMAGLAFQGSMLAQEWKVRSTMIEVRGNSAFGGAPVCRAVALNASCGERTSMRIGMTIGAIGEVQSSESCCRRLLRLVATITAHRRVQSCQSKSGRIVIELRCWFPLRLRVAR
jgi:hypothetical protein